MTMPEHGSEIIASGAWQEHVGWEFHLTDEVPEVDLCTAVYCLAIADDAAESVVLTKNQRGWEMLGGHIEPGETLEEAMTREAIEEGGFLPSWYQPFGYRKITAQEPVIDDHHGGYYPPIAYIPHFVARTDSKLIAPSGEEITDAAVFHVEDLPSLESSQAAIVIAGIAAYKRFKGL